MKIVIIGASHAGIAAAKRARILYPEASIRLFERKDKISFISQNALFYILDQQTRTLEAGNYTSVEALEALGIEVNTNVNVKKIDSEKKQIDYVTLKNQQLGQVTYDKLIFAAGSFPRMPVILGETPENLFILKSFGDALKLNEKIKKGHRAFILGSGAIGVELARILVKRGMKVTLVERDKRIMGRTLDVQASMALEKELISDGIDVQVSEMAMSFEKDKKKIKVVTDLRTVEVDMVIFAAGFRPNTKLLQNQVTLSQTGGIVTNAYLETSQKDIFAIGDCAEVYSDLFKGGIYVPHAADAIRTGDAVAYNLLTPSRKVDKTQATMSIDMGDYYICTAGLKLEKALALGYQAKMVTFTNVHYEGDKYTAWMVYDTENHHILGMQILGTVCSANAYINMTSLAISQKITIECLAATDFYFEHGFKNPSGFFRILADLVQENAEKK